MTTSSTVAAKEVQRVYPTRQTPAMPAVLMQFLNLFSTVPEVHDFEAYLNGEMEGEFRATSTQVTTVWAKARKASRTIGVEWELQPNGARITTGGASLSLKHRSKVMKTLRGHQQAYSDANSNSLLGPTCDS